MKTYIVLIMIIALTSCGDEGSKIVDVKIIPPVLNKDSIAKLNQKNFLDSFCISGKVLDINTLEPIAGAAISTIPAKFSGLTDGNGYFKIKTDPLTKYVVKAEKQGEYYPACRVSGWDSLGSNNGVLLACKISDNPAPPGDITILGPKNSSKVINVGFDFFWMCLDAKSDIEQTNLIVLDSAYRVVASRYVYLGNRDTYGKSLAAGKYYWLVAIKDAFGAVAISELNFFNIMRK